MSEKYVFPPAYTEEQLMVPLDLLLAGCGVYVSPVHKEGGIRLPHIPNNSEMENCGYAARKKAECPRKKGKRQMVIGGPAPLIDCSTCQYHPENIPIKQKRRKDKKT